MMEYQRRIFSAMDFINRNLGENLPLEEVARKAHFSKYHFHRLFRTLVGETVSDFTLRLRLEKSARALVWNTDKNITDIAFEYGFSSSQHFATSFRKYFRTTPSRYRKKFVKSEATTDDYYRATARNNPWTNDPGDFSWPDLPQNKPFPYQVEIKEMDELHLAYKRVIGSFLRPLIAKKNHIVLSRWAKKTNIRPGKLVRVFWDDPDITLLEKYRSDDCIIVPKGTVGSHNINIQILPGVTCAVCRAELSRIRDLKEIWRQFWPGWLLESEYQPADPPCFEIFQTIGDLDPHGRWVIDLCMPIKPLS